MSRYDPLLGATWTGGDTRFVVWAPEATKVDLVVEAPGPQGEYPMQPGRDGHFTLSHAAVGPGHRYRYRVDGAGPFPDPASRFQPEGVHGPSEVIDSGAYTWGDAGWSGVPLERLVLYELHVGTFTDGGTYAGLAGRLSALADLGVTAVLLMPLADFAGRWNWGYDGVAPFASARCYGRPDDLRALVDQAHRLGLAVHLDVVYNHFGPDGAYQGSFSPGYASRTHRSPWGSALNFDGPDSRPVRRYVIENALRWIHEFHIDGLRLDATHAIVDRGPVHILAELAAAVHASLAGTGRQAHVIAEDAQNLAHLVERGERGGYGLDAVWSDDFHHQVRASVAGDRDGYFADFDGRTESIAATARQGWYYTGQQAPYFGGPRGSDPAGIPLSRFVVFLQNHDQVGNRAFGERLHHQVDLAVWRALSVLLLLLPETPLLFMGQEWAAGSPFRYFTDHTPELGRAVTEGRRREFSRFEAFADPTVRETIPDPQAQETVVASHLDWSEREREPHAGVLRLYRRLLALRRGLPPLEDPAGSSGFTIAAEGDVLRLERPGPDSALLALVRLRGAGATKLGKGWRALLTTEDPEYTADPLPVELGAEARFARPGAVVLSAAARRG
ncbi:MAG: malto-oligosyltrehalose trehalohydrolase [Gemmatimonadales bacterium]